LQPDWNPFLAGTAPAKPAPPPLLACGSLRASLAVLLLAFALAPAAPAAGADPEPKTQPPPAVELDRLLKLPSTVEVQREQIGSATRSQWRARFASARAEHEAALAGLESAQKKLGEVAETSEAWQMAPPGAGATGGASETPVDYQLRQEVRRQREDLIRSEKNLRELTIEADLAGVPADWRE
jgi:hypothetical protein